MVFRTAPPQLALKASMTMAPFAVGGPAARRNGFGKVMPRNSVINVDMMISTFGKLQPVKLLNNTYQVSFFFWK